MPPCPGTLRALVYSAFPPAALPGKILLGHYDSAEAQPCPSVLPKRASLPSWSLVMLDRSRLVDRGVTTQWEAFWGT